MGWTPEQDERLIQLASEGFSGSVIAKMMGVGTRNAVIGRAFRIGLQLRSGSNHNHRLMQGRPKRGPYKPRPAKVVKETTPKRRRRWFTFHYDPKANPAEAKTQPIAPTEVPIPDNMPPARATGAADALAALQPHDCRWTIGDPQHPDFRFCGARKEPGRSYCSYHRAASIGGWYGYEEGKEQEGEGERDNTVEGG
jgi:GcrA cell cycle regulator